MTNKLTLTAAAVLVAFSSTAAVGTANAASRPMDEQANHAYAWAAPASADVPDAHRYHGGPKAND